MVNVVFLHPDLGIGGAERLVVDAAVALKGKGHNVSFVTAHHDPSHCFTETKDGTLHVTCVGDWLPRSIFGFCYALCAYMRMVYAAIYLVFFSDIVCDVVVCDLVSACIPIFKWKSVKVLFYCHFPDQLLTARRSLLKRIYRAPLDWLEQTTTGMADRVLVNSHFTAQVFRDTFTQLTVEPDVLYPSLNFSAFDGPIPETVEGLKLEGVKTLFLSINRYERKKNLGLAILALERIRQLVPVADWEGVHLIIAGGYDERVGENVGYHDELVRLVEELNLDSKVSFLRSISDVEKRSLLHSCTSLIYTPDKEHFGIVPIEAMYLFRPVIAVNSGGPKETVVHEQTGFLCDPTPKSFAEAMKKFVADKDLAREMGRNGREHVVKLFSFDSFTEQLNNVVVELCQEKSKDD